MTSQHDSALARRVNLNNEWHARPKAQMRTPFRCTHEVFRRPPGETRLAALTALCTQYGQAGPSKDSRHHLVQLGSALVKWEGHTEADSLTCLVPGSSQQPFAESARNMAPSELGPVFGSELLCGVKVEMLKAPEQEPAIDRLRDLLGGEPIYGGEVADGRASIWTSLRLDGQGYTRLILVDHNLAGGASGRLLQRALEIESYRMQAMDALPLARQTMGELNRIEAELEPLMTTLTGDVASVDHAALLTELSSLAARVEHLATCSSYRFAAARAYANIVEQRLSELRERRQLNQPRYSVFVLRSLQPAMRTCEAAGERIEKLADRISRALNLLNSMVDMIQTRQSIAMMKSMDRNSRMQLRLQEAVEGFSIFAISYYGLGLLHYVLTAGVKAGLAIDAKLITGVAAPVVLILVWANTRWIRRRMTREDDE